MSSSDTIAAIATAPGRGGVAVVRVSGPGAFAIGSALSGRELSAAQAGRFFHVQLRSPSTRVPLDDALLLVFAAPRSYTGEDVVELQCHGGSVTPRRVLEACMAAGARLARRGEYTERAFLNGRLDLAAAEAVIDLIDARTVRAADDALARLGGTAAQLLETFYASAIDIASQLEHSLDFSEDELPSDFSSRLDAAIAALVARIDRRLSTAREGRLLHAGALVVLAGEPNAGKSSLLNALLDERRAIVSAEAGTTRDSIEAWAEIGGWPVRLVDTAGLRTTDNPIEAEGVARADELIAMADLVLRLRPNVKREMENGEAAREIVIASKGDLWGEAPKGWIKVSAVTGEGLDALRKQIAERLTLLAAREEEAAAGDVTLRQQECLQTARTALARAREALAMPEWVLAANEVRAAAEALGRLLGKICGEDLLDAVFSRFCVGK